MRTIDVDQFWPFPPEASAPSAVDTRPPPRASHRPEPLHRYGFAQPGAADVAASATAFNANRFTSRLETITADLRGASQDLALRGAAFMNSFDAKAAVWLSTGFVCGMISWHAVGFWGFVSESVLHSSTRTSNAVAALPERPQLAPSSQITTGSLPSFQPKPGACMALTVERETGQTIAQHCNGGDQPLRDAGRRRRGDRLSGVQARMNDAGAWSSATTATQAITNPGPPAEVIADRDFDLTINATP